MDGKLDHDDYTLAYCKIRLIGAILKEKWIYKMQLEESVSYNAEPYMMI
jgi:hypothetical protein